MKRDPLEQRISGLFQRLRLDDETAAPRFESTVAASSSQKRNVVGFSLVLRAAAVAALIALLAAGWAVFHKWRGTDRSTIARQQEVPGAAGPIKIPPKSPPPLTPVPPTAGPSPAHRLASDHVGSARKTDRTPQFVSQWQSPTSYLLKTPADELLNTVPRLEDSIVRISPVALPDNN